MSVFGVPLQKQSIAKQGSDCTGTDGAANRTLDVSAGITTDNLVYVAGRCLHPTSEYTYSGSVITFVVNIFDADLIRVIT